MSRLTDTLAPAWQKLQAAIANRSADGAATQAPARAGVPTSLDDTCDMNEQAGDRIASTKSSLGSLARLFRPWSSGRQRLTRMYDMLASCTPTPPPYEFQHLARWAKTIEHLEPLARPGERWLDVASDPWCAGITSAELARVGPVDLIPTGFMREEFTLEFGAGRTYRYQPAELLITKGMLDFNLGNDFDLVMSLEMIEHLKFHPAGFLAGMNNALRPGGSLVITTPNVASWATIDRILEGATPHLTPQYGGDAHHRKEYTVWEMSQLVEAAGFKVAKVTTFDCYASDYRTLPRKLHYAGTLAWQGATLQAKRVRNMLLQFGSTMLIHAVKTGPCDVERVARIAV